MFTKIINKLKTMAKIELTQLSAANKTQAIEALTAYKRQNPVKFAAKKDALFTKYGLNEDTQIDEVKDEADVQLEKIKEKVIKENK